MALAPSTSITQTFGSSPWRIDMYAILAPSGEITASEFLRLVSRVT
jgi:hypothetical protein